MPEKEIHSRTKIGLLSLTLSVLEVFCPPSLPTVSCEVLSILQGAFGLVKILLAPSRLRAFAPFPYVVGRPSRPIQHIHGG
jgi:hypothetical protein